MNLQNRKRLTDLKSELIIAGKGRESYQVWDGHVHTAIFKMDNQQGPAVQHMELWSMFCGSLHGRGVWGRVDTGICVAESLCCSPEGITALFVNQLHPNTK